MEIPYVEDLKKIGAPDNISGRPNCARRFGCTHAQNASTGRITWYEEHRKAIESHGFAASVWDDDGGFKVYDRQANMWDEPVVEALLGGGRML
jgi:hypothetical protein